MYAVVRDSDFVTLSVAEVGEDVRVYDRIGNGRCVAVFGTRAEADAALLAAEMDRGPVT